MGLGGTAYLALGGGEPTALGWHASLLCQVSARLSQHPCLPGGRCLPRSHQQRQAMLMGSAC